MENNLSRQACLMGVDVSIFGVVCGVVVFFNAVRVSFEHTKLRPCNGACGTSQFLYSEREGHRSI
jgi:hypothetical protein